MQAIGDGSTVSDTQHSMYYHAAVLLLFRPFLKAKFTQSDISPQEVCRASAAAISQIFDQHRRRYDSIGMYTLQIHCLLAACTVHVINVPAIASTQYLTVAANHFHHLASLNGWAAECISILIDLIAKWNIVLPMEAEVALYQTGTASPSDTSEGIRNKRSATGAPSVPPIPQPKKPKLAVPRMLSQSSGGSLPNSDPSRRPSLLPETSSASSSSQLNYLFNPVPNQPTPLLAPFHTSNFVDAAMLQGQMMQYSLSDFDGMTFDLGGGEGWFDTFMGYDGAEPKA
jgi:hypothetical protein